MVGVTTPQQCFFCAHPLNRMSATALICPACEMAEFVNARTQPQQQQQQQQAQPKKDEPKE